MSIRAHQRVVTWPGETTILQKTVRGADLAIHAESEEVIAVAVVAAEETVHGVETERERSTMAGIMMRLDHFPIAS